MLKEANMRPKMHKNSLELVLRWLCTAEHGAHPKRGLWDSIGENLIFFCEQFQLEKVPYFPKLRAENFFALEL